MLSCLDWIPLRRSPLVSIITTVSPVLEALGRFCVRLIWCVSIYPPPFSSWALEIGRSRNRTLGPDKCHLRTVQSLLRPFAEVSYRVSSHHFFLHYHHFLILFATPHCITNNRLCSVQPFEVHSPPFRQSDEYLIVFINSQERCDIDRQIRNHAWHTAPHHYDERYRIEKNQGLLLCHHRIRCV